MLQFPEIFGCSSANILMKQLFCYQRDVTVCKRTPDTVAFGERQILVGANKIVLLRWSIPLQISIVNEDCTVVVVFLVSLNSHGVYWR